MTAALRLAPGDRSPVPLDREWRTARVIWFAYHGPRNPKRGLWATWDDERLLWLCHIAGVELAPRQFTAPTQSSALTECRYFTWASRYRAKPAAGLWDGRPDVFLLRPRPGSQYDLFGLGWESPSSNTGLLSQNETGHFATRQSFPRLINDLTPKQGGVAFVSKIGASA